MHMQQISVFIFINGKNTQTVRILIPESWDDFFDNTKRLSADFEMERNMTPPNERKEGDHFKGLL